MKGLIYLLMAAAVIGLGSWAYRENYATQASLKTVRALSAEINATQARLDRLHAEWAYLNRPDRLRDLAELNFGRLELLPMRPEAFADVEEVPMPPVGGADAILSSNYLVTSDASATTEEPL